MSFNISGNPFQLGTEIGQRIARLRLSQNITQEMLAKSSGISPRTLRRMEAGQSVSLENFLRVAITLKLADGLLAAVPSYDIRPMERVERGRRERQRARPKRTDPQPPSWSWD